MDPFAKDDRDAPLESIEPINAHGIHQFLFAPHVAHIGRRSRINGVVTVFPTANCQPQLVTAESRNPSERATVTAAETACGRQINTSAPTVVPDDAEFLPSFFADAISPAGRTSLLPGVTSRRTAVSYHFLRTRDVTISHNTKKPAKYRDHGGRAALLSTDVELMVWHNRTCRRPVHGIGRGRGQRINIANQ